MNIFEKLERYCSWTVTAKRPFEQGEIDQVARAYVRPSNYGMSVCFLMKDGSRTFVPLDSNSEAMEGDVVDLHQAQIVTLSKPGEEDINRILV